MFSPLSQLRAAAVHVESFGGFDFEIGRVTNRELAGVRRYQLLVSRTPSDTERILSEEWAKRVRNGADALATYRALSDEQRQIAVEAISDEIEEAAEEMRTAVLAASVRRWRPSPVDGESPQPWRLCSVVPGGELVEGDGETTPDVIPIGYLPGGPVFAQVLASRAITISGCTEVEARRLATFRGGP